MPSRIKPKVPKGADDKKQSERFIETAQELETDETGKDLEKAFKGISRSQKRSANQRS